MIYNFRIVSDEVDNFRREIQIDADMTFADFKNVICDSVGYDKNQMCSFFLCDNNWDKEREITLEDMGSDSSEDVYLMEDTILSDFIEEEGQRLMFTFDYMTDRSFYIEMKEIITGRTLKDPLCTMSRGVPPAQNIDLDEFDAKADAKAAALAAADDMDEDFYGSDGYNEDEFKDFDEMTFDE
ncbi:MAG: plasmid pRiA4b ORF-3 family protein [Bacteroidales bacterium]|nr:plasmid pRiA4b ORF-3 family protein [Bacteroidales bacterium]